MNKLKKLLERWAELELNRCIRNWPTDLEDHAFQAGLLYAVIKAIEARRWGWSTGFNLASNLHWGCIFTISDKHDDVCETSDRSPGAALLKAYVQAIEKTQEATP